ncbi:MAG: hypothetical protein KIT09_16680 [Bryobacteraceae bacterium]|nr:hypothetical protein [Bryobacteraceae bacterium]
MILAVGLFLLVPARGQIQRAEALAQTFLDARIESERIFLTEAERTRAEQLSGVNVPSLLIARYVARKDGEVVGWAYVDTHVVRTKNESLLIALNPDRSVRRIEVTAFLEPPEYKASGAWYSQFDGRRLSDDLNLQRAIRPIAGASLTGIATTQAVRRVLAIDRILSERN